MDSDIMLSLNSLKFDTLGWQPTERTSNRSSWTNGFSDVLSIQLFTVPPDIPADLAEVEQVRAFCRRSVQQAGGGIVSVDVLSVRNLSIVKTIFKFPQLPHGTAYLGSLTIPFANASYVIKVQSEEFGTTGVREAVVLDRLLRSGAVCGSDGLPLNLWQDPYDPTDRSPVLRNLAEDEIYDASFPDHPLSRVRKCLARIEMTLEVHDEVLRYPPFPPGGKNSHDGVS